MWSLSVLPLLAGGVATGVGVVCGPVVGCGAVATGTGAVTGTGAATGADEGPFQLWSRSCPRYWYLLVSAASTRFATAGAAVAGTCVWLNVVEGGVAGGAGSGVTAAAVATGAGEGEGVGVGARVGVEAGADTPPPGSTGTRRRERMAFVGAGCVTGDALCAIGAR